MHPSGSSPSLRSSLKKTGALLVLFAGAFPSLRAADPGFVGPPLPQHGEFSIIPPAVEPPPPPGNEVPLSLEVCVRMAMERNLDISIESLNPQIARSQTLSARGAFDPLVTFNSQYGESSSPRSAEQIAADGTTSVISRNTSHGLGISQKTALGTELSLSANTRDSENTFNRFRDQYNSFSGATFSQPLLRNFGPANTLAPIKIARRGEAAADASFQFQLEQVITDVSSAYYDLIYARQNLEAQQQGLELARQLLEDNKARVEIGTMSPLDVSQANAQVASRQDLVLQSEQSLRDQENVLKRLITADVLAWLEKRILPEDMPVNNYEPPLPQVSIGEALHRRADLREAVERAEQSNIQVKFSENQLLPQVDLTGSYGYAGLDDHLDGSFRRVGSTDDPQWYVGIQLAVPLGNRENRGQLDGDRLRKKQSLLNLKKLEQDIIVQVDNAAEQVHTNKERIASARQARLSAEESLKAEQEKLQAGSSTSFVVLQLQSQLTDARVAEQRAIADLKKSIAELSRVEGKALADYNIYTGTAASAAQMATGAGAPKPPPQAQ